MSWRATILTIFPELFPGPLGASLAGKALAGGVWSCEAVDIRDFGEGKHRSVDDTPAGGGPGMVMKADVLARAIDSVTQRDDSRPKLLMSPRGKPLDQARVRELAAGPGVLLLAARFEGVDERLIEARNLAEISIGDYVLSGGEIAAKGERGRAPHLEGRGPRWGCGDLGIPEERKRAVATQRRDSGEIGLRERRAEIANENDSRGLICSCHRSTLSTFKTASQ
jgi:hypothetical protein